MEESHHYDLLSSTVIATSSTMLTLIATIGISNKALLASVIMRYLLAIDLSVLGVALLFGVHSLLKKTSVNEETMKIGYDEKRKKDRYKVNVTLSKKKSSAIRGTLFLIGGSFILIVISMYAILTA